MTLESRVYEYFLCHGNSLRTEGSSEGAKSAGHHGNQEDKEDANQPEFRSVVVKRNCEHAGTK